MILIKVLGEISKKNPSKYLLMRKVHLKPNRVYLAPLIVKQINIVNSSNRPYRHA